MLWFENEATVVWQDNKGDTFQNCSPPPKKISTRPFKNMYVHMKKMDCGIKNNFRLWNYLKEGLKNFKGGLRYFLRKGLKRF